MLLLQYCLSLTGPWGKAEVSGKAMHAAEGRQRICRVGANFGLVASSITKKIIG